MINEIFKKLIHLPQYILQHFSFLARWYCLDQIGKKKGALSFPQVFSNYTF